MTATPHILTHVIADFNDVRATLMKEIRILREIGCEDDETVTLTVTEIEKLVERLTQGIKGLCHVANPARHTSVVSEECTYADA
jgi:hypothetical protein